MPHCVIYLDIIEITGKKRGLRHNWFVQKRVAIKYKEFLDQIGIVSSEVLITGPDSREGKKQLWRYTTDGKIFLKA